MSETLREQLETAQARVKELEYTFDLRWKADMRGIERWQAATGRQLTWPDHADLVVWLLEQLEAAEQLALGHTGEFPDGKLNENDEGQLQSAIWNHNGNVLVDFGNEVAWIGFDPQGAADFASSILKHARIAAKERGVPINFNLMMNNHD